MDPAAAIELEILSQQQPINDAIARGDSDVQRFYCNNAVFVTGVSGFMGKQLVEKLFRSCKIRKMFLLMRPKKGKDVQQRYSEILKDPVFDVLRKNQPGFQERIVIVEGDVGLPRLGISDEHWNAITEEVTVIFHGAATTKFDEPLGRATLTNVRGTRDMLDLGRACKQLRSFIYVSTAYSHATISRIGGEVLEKFYPVPISPDIMIQLAESMNPEKLNEIAGSLMEDWPNTYCFTKSLAEELVRTRGAGIPSCIIRPAIVIAAYREPLPGWVDVGNVNGASGLVVGFMTGVIHVTHSKSNAKIDFVPADLVNNAIISAGRETGKRWDDGERETKIYTVTSMRNHLTMADCLRIFHKEVRGIMSPKALWYLCVFEANNDFKYALLRFMFHNIPARVVDGACTLLGKQPKLRSLYEKVEKMASVLKYFTTNDWAFCDKNLLALYDKMSENDKIIYNFDVANFSKETLFLVWAVGIRKYILKDGLKGTAYSVKKQRIMKILSLFILVLYVLCLWMFIQFIIIMINGIIM